MQHFSSAAERNKTPILIQLSKWLKGDENILEIGSGTGQHALFFATHFSTIRWQCTDRQAYLLSLTDNIQNGMQPHVLPPIELDVINYDWALMQYDVVYTANTLHIMTQVEADFFLNHVHLALKPNGKLIIYGPFKYNGVYTSDSNHEFDKMLRQRGVGSGIKAF